MRKAAASQPKGILNPEVLQQHVDQYLEKNHLTPAQAIIERVVRGKRYRANRTPGVLLQGGEIGLDDWKQAIWIKERDNRIKRSKINQDLIVCHAEMHWPGTKILDAAQWKVVSDCDSAEHKQQIEQRRQELENPAPTTD